MEETESAKPAPRPGEAAIKPKYIVKRSHSREGRAVVETNPPVTTNSEPPPTKRRKKERGQNKRRPRAAKVNRSDQLCPSLYQGSDRSDRSCQFGEKCRYCHDTAAYLAKKPPDIGSTCHLFDTLGRCPYGLACRCGNSHMTSDLQNVTDEQVYDPNRIETTINVISRTLQENLRKKRIELPKSERFLRNFSLRAACRGDGRGDGGGGKGGEGEGEKVREGEKEREGADENGESGATEEDMADLGEGHLTTEKAECSAGDGDGVAVTALPEGVSSSAERTMSGAVTDEDLIRMRPEEIKQIDFKDKLYLAPLTTVGNLPFRRICKEFGADITCGEMAMATNLLQGQQSEWALLKRHASEDLFGVQVCGAHVDSMTRCAEVVSTYAEVDFIDVNVGCPIDLLCNKGAGCSLMNRRTRFEAILRGMTAVSGCPVTVKMRTGVHDRNWNAHKLLPRLRDCGVAMATVHGRSREQRYTRMADWEYISECSEAAAPLPVFGCGDVLSYEDHELHSSQAGIMIARGALIKPWIFTEIKERRHWDISSSERMEMLRRYTNYGLEHWGSDTIGVENTRKFLLEWLSFLYRYIPVGLLERVPQKINERPPLYEGRDELETLMASHYCQDWIKISEMLLGPVPDNFTFLPKHKANSYL